uniref:Uncharacterized protein LOC111103437 n=1 Tax=Crassostrea virginica TaxID=6565 RepID=A0A8B8AMY2_CRAVI|nr:uncharacterized protein LOC111103437 [Crassostrea virginica]
MDPETSCQDIQRCQVCKLQIADFFCAYCEAKLCKRCVGAHLAEDPEKHRIVKLLDKYTTLVLPICATHSQERCKNYCQQCDLAVCTSCVSSKSHERHKFLTIVDIFKRKKEIIKNDSAELEQEIFPSYEEIIKQVKFNGKRVQEKFEEVLNDIEKQRKIWHQEIDLMVNALKDDVGGMQKTQTKVQSDHLNRLQELLVEVRQSIQRNKDLLESLEISKSLSYYSMNSALKRFPPKLEISVPRFIPKAIENEMNSEKIGIITGFCISNQEGGYQLKSQSGVVPGGSSKEDENGENIPKEVLNEPQIITTIETKIKGPKNVACTNDGNLWVSGDDGPIQLFKIHAPVNVSRLSFGAINSSVILKNVTAGIRLNSIAVNKTGHLLFGTVLSNTISIYKENETNELINLKSWSLLSLCITGNDCLLVCMTDAKGYSCRVVRFEESEERQIIQYDSKGKRLFPPGKTRKQVKENCNGDICVADFYGRYVVVTDKTGTFRFRWSESLNRLTGIATDTQAQIIVATAYTDILINVFNFDVRINIIDRNGHFLRSLNISQKCTNVITEVGLDVDSEDNLYIADFMSTVKKIRYMKHLNQ